MTVTSVINHTGYEIYPDSWLKSLFGKHVISASHHSLHHEKYSCNFALYFRFWDKLMGTDLMESEYEFLRPSSQSGVSLKAGDAS